MSDMTSQMGFFDVGDRLAELSKKGDPLERLSRTVDFELFRPELERAVPRSDRAKGGRPPFDHIVMFKVLVIQTLYTLSDEQTEFQIKDRLSFQRFLGLGLGDTVPDANTIWTFREALTKAKAIEGLLRRFDAALKNAGYLAMSGQIIDASIVAAPRLPSTTRAASASCSTRPTRRVRSGRTPPIARARTSITSIARASSRRSTSAALPANRSVGSGRKRMRPAAGFVPASSGSLPCRRIRWACSSAPSGWTAPEPRSASPTWPITSSGLSGSKGKRRWRDSHQVADRAADERPTERACSTPTTHSWRQLRHTSSF